MKNLSQEKRIVNKLLRDGYITSNECANLQFNRIKRLAVHINNLKKKGWEFDTKSIKETKDYIYKLTFSPLHKTVYVVEGREIITYK